MSAKTTSLAAEAMRLGAEHGRKSGSWVIDGNTSNAFAEKVITGYDDKDPEVMDMCPNPLSGEFSDDPTVADVLIGLGLRSWDERADDMIDAYEDAYQIAWWETVIQACYAMLPGYEPCGVCNKYGHKWTDHA